MLFHSPLFLAFFTVTVAVAALLAPRPRRRHVFLLAASYVFYMAWNAWLIGLIVFSTLLDYRVGAAIHRTASARRRRVLLAVSLTGNLGLLGTFKYYDFFADSLDRLLAAFGLDVGLPLLHLILPVGISFYTFQTLSYTIEIYRGELEPADRFVDFALFVAFFPQLVAGPIVRAREFLPQLHRPVRILDSDAREGLYRFLEGLVKKLLFADVLAYYLVDPVLADPARFGGLWILLAVWGFKFQIYGDFAGYSDMAIGCAKLLGFDIPENFRAPYKARSVSEYWRRWHLTLGRWFRDFLFFPLGGSRGGLARTCRNVLLTMTLIGLWHGAAWAFVFWGTYHGVALCLERLWRAVRPAAGEPPAWLVPLQVFAVFNVTAVATISFRVPDMTTLGIMARRLLASGAVPEIPLWAAGLMALAVLTHFAPESWKEALGRHFVTLPAVAEGALAGAVVILGLLVVRNLEPFFYFQF